MRTYFIAFRKDSIRVEFVIPARGRHEARTIAEKEAEQLRGYRFMGGN